MNLTSETPIVVAMTSAAAIQRNLRRDETAHFLESKHYSFFSSALSCFSHSLT